MVVTNVKLNAKVNVRNAWKDYVFNATHMVGLLILILKLVLKIVVIQLLLEENNVMMDMILTRMMDAINVRMCAEMIV